MGVPLLLSLACSGPTGKRVIELAPRLESPNAADRCGCTGTSDKECATCSIWDLPS
jgi:hypothetical protein